MATDIAIQRRQLDAVRELRSAADLVGDEVWQDRVAGVQAALHDGKLRIALAGEFGNGKSSVANSLIGSALLPTGSAPAARAPAEVIQGPEPRTVLVYEDGVRADTSPGEIASLGSDLVDRLTRIEIEAPAPFLEHAVLLDTPGTGLSGSQPGPGASPGRLTDATLAEAHCIVFVLNCDRLLSMTERTYIAEHVARVGAARICFVLNHADGKTPDEISSLVDRARHLLSTFVPEPVIMPYSALPAGRSKAERAAGYANTGELQSLVTQSWIEERRSIIAESTALKIGDIAAALEDRIGHLKESAEKRVEALTEEVARAERELLELEERSETTSRRATASVQALREQFVVGLKDYALKLRESVPSEVVQVAVDDARRFLPFYIQDSLRRAVSENDRPLNAAVAEALEPLGDEIGPAMQTLISGFQVDVEPPVIPLYVARDRAALTQGASYVLMAATAVLFNDFPLGSLMLAGGLITREIGRQLEAADRRVTLADSAQRLVHGSITTMEGSVTEQFAELENALVNIVRDTFAPQIEADQQRIAKLQTERAAALDQQSQAMTAVTSATEKIEGARKLLEDVSDPKPDAAVKRARRAARTSRPSPLPNEASEPAGVVDAGTGRPDAGG